MNLCVISEYTCTFDDFEGMVEQNQNEEVIDKDKLSNIKMPNRNGFILNHH